ncbi:sulfur carrier protein ThiS [Alicyclobacillus sacchari]|uniref:Sulfur carrier protein ThiS n=1 Tax=Alicyclobacillus sacchari TaxID=392010 RepID=A0A4R8LUG0_9BACL|nr:sulfur carrier protein ThiS [Alicyclobacillus sacchari]TDY51410.1 sulfur carrier protein ThiS [Alicyclobacillus sacchari]GMA56753.1 sulfur carrier protein ThiS [Alicyclobacillus sacchari]
MQVTVNGKSMDVPDGLTVEGLLVQFNLVEERVAVEHNQRVLDRGAFAETVLASGDVIEVVRFVGGG